MGIEQQPDNNRRGPLCRLVGFLRGLRGVSVFKGRGCSSGTLRIAIGIARGTLGKIRGITTPPLRILLMMAEIPNNHLGYIKPLK